MPWGDPKSQEPSRYISNIQSALKNSASEVDLAANIITLDAYGTFRGPN